MAATSGTGPPDTEPDRWIRHRLAVLVRAGWWISAAAGLSLLAGNLAGVYVFDDAHRRLLDPNLPGAPFTWASVVATSAVATAALVSGLVTGRRSAYALAGLTAFLSLDDLTGLHEDVAQAVVRAVGAPAGWASVLWPLAYLPVMAATSVLLLRHARRGTRASLGQAACGLGLLVVAVVLELASSRWPAEGDRHVLGGGLEESAELAGWVLLATATCAALVADVVRSSRAGPPRPGQSRQDDGSASGAWANWLR